MTAPASPVKTTTKGQGEQRKGADHQNVHALDAWEDIRSAVSGCRRTSKRETLQWPVWTSQRHPHLLYNRHRRALRVQTEINQATAFEKVMTCRGPDSGFARIRNRPPRAFQSGPSCPAAPPSSRFSPNPVPASQLPPPSLQDDAIGGTLPTHWWRGRAPTAARQMTLGRPLLMVCCPTTPKETCAACMVHACGCGGGGKTRNHRRRRSRGACGGQPGGDTAGDALSAVLYASNAVSILRAIHLYFWHPIVCGFYHGIA